jgi:predicted ester cyclase
VVHKLSGTKVTVFRESAKTNFAAANERGIVNSRYSQSTQLIRIHLPVQEKGNPMSVEQVARDFVSNMKDLQKIQSMLTPDAMVDGGVLPQPMPAMEAFQIVSGLYSALPDLKFDIQQVTVNGNQATVDILWHGTQTKTFTPPMPGMMPIPATGKAVSVKDKFIITVQGDKVSHMTVDSPADGGIPAALGQMGAKPPSA